MPAQAPTKPKLNGNRVAQLRHCKGWEIVDLVREIDHQHGHRVSASHLRNIEADNVRASAKLSGILASVLGATVAQLLDNRGRRK